MSKIHTALTSLRTLALKTLQFKLSSNDRHYATGVVDTTDHAIDVLDKEEAADNKKKAAS